MGEEEKVEPSYNSLLLNGEFDFGEMDSIFAEEEQESESVEETAAPEEQVPKAEVGEEDPYFVMDIDVVAEKSETYRSKAAFGKYMQKETSTPKCLKPKNEKPKNKKPKENKKRIQKENKKSNIMRSKMLDTYEAKKEKRISNMKMDIQVDGYMKQEMRISSTEVKSKWKL